jgi:probable biosynthetic protein (TIGR04098 family)
MTSARYSLTLGLPHTNLNGLAEHLLLMQAGHFQWNTISSALKTPMSSLRAPGGGEVYATYFYVEENYPAGKTLDTYRLDQTLCFLNQIRHDRGIAIDGKVVFDLSSRLGEGEKTRFETNPDSMKGEYPFLHMCNAFIARDGGNQKLKMCAPQGVSFDSIDPLPAGASQYAQVREAAARLSFGLLEGYEPGDAREDFTFTYPLNPDRDTNGAGLVYFANYICFLDLAEREALRQNSRVKWSEEQINLRTLLKRKLAYQANVSLTDRLKIQVLLFKGPSLERGVRSIIRRDSDNALVALSECLKTIPS